MERGRVPADNSCLFTAVARLCMGETAEIQLKVAGRKLREKCAASVLADPDPQTRALLLGHDSVDAYGEWIRNEHHWGGEPEVVMLAEHFGVSIAVVSCESLRVLQYSPGAATSTGCIYLLYTGQHYDPLLGSDGTLVFAEASDEREASALALAAAHNEEAARRAKEKRVNRLKCSGCGVLCDDAAAFQAHCGEVEHDDDFTYECETVEVVVQEGEELPEGSIDLNSADVHAFYARHANEAVSLSMRFEGAPFELAGVGSFATLEDFWRSDAVESAPAADRPGMLLEAVRAQHATPAAASSGLREHLLSTGSKMVVAVDTDPWLGMQAAGGLSAGQNALGVALMKVRDELAAAAAS